MTWWQWILVISASLVIAIFIAVSALIAILKAKLKKWGSGLGDAFKSLATSPIPETLTLLPCAESEVDKRPGLRETVNEVKSLGFDLDGPYFADENKTTIVYLTAKPDVEMMGMIMAAPNRTPVADFVTYYEDGTMAMHTNLEDLGMDRPIQHRVERHPTLTPTEVYNAHLRDRPDKAKLRYTIADVPAVAKKAVEDEWFWRATRGGLTDAELERQMARAAPTDGTAPAGFNTAAMIRTVVRARAQGFLEELFRKQLLESGDLSAARWEEIEDRLVFVTDAGDPEVLASHLYSASHDEHDEEEESDDGSYERFIASLKEGPRRETFRQLNDQLPTGRQLEFLRAVRVERKLATAIADIYVSAREADEED